MNLFERITSDIILPGIYDIPCFGIFNCLGYYAGKAFEILFLLVVAGGIIAILYGGFTVISGGEKAFENGKKIVIRGIVGVIIGALAYISVVALLRTLYS